LFAIYSTLQLSPGLNCDTQTIDDTDHEFVITVPGFRRSGHGNWQLPVDDCYSCVHLWHFLHKNICSE